MNDNNTPPEVALGAMTERLKAILLAEQYWEVIGHGLAQNARMVAPRLPTALPASMSRVELNRLGREAPGVLFCVGAN